jgi:hypothetical protein
MSSPSDARDVTVPGDCDTNFPGHGRRITGAKTAEEREATQTFSVPTRPPGNSPQGDEKGVVEMVEYEAIFDDVQDVTTLIMDALTSITKTTCYEIQVLSDLCTVGAKVPAISEEELNKLFQHRIELDNLKKRLQRLTKDNA